jgi:hypothetical protein
MTEERNQDRRQGYSLRGHIGRLTSTGRLARVGLALVAALTVSGVTFARCRSADVTGPDGARQTQSSGGSADLLTDGLTSDVSTEMLDIMAELGVPLLTAASGEPSATGGVEYVDDVQPGLVAGEGAAKLAFSAILHADGSVSGEFEFRRVDLGTRVHGDVVCVLVIGTTAHILGKISQSTFADILQVTTFAQFSVNDRGEGSNDLPDLVSPFVDVGPTPDFDPPANCPQSNAPVFDVQRGNLQVRQGDGDVLPG